MHERTGLTVSVVRTNAGSEVNRNVILADVLLAQTHSEIFELRREQISAASSASYGHVACIFRVIRELSDSVEEVPHAQKT